MSSGTYFPPPVKAVEIPKTGAAGTRILGVPTVADRIAQTVVALTSGSPDGGDLPSTTPTGTGPGVRRWTRWRACRQRCWKKDWVLDLDVAKFFDSVDHGPHGQGGGRPNHHRQAVGAAVCEAVAESPAAASPTAPCTSGTGEPRRGRRFRPCWPTCSCTTRSICSWPGVPDRGVRALCGRRGGALRDRAAGPQGAGLRSLRGWTRSGCGCTRTRPGSCTARTTGGGARIEHTSFTFLGYTFRPRRARYPDGKSFTSLHARGQRAGPQGR